MTKTELKKTVVKIKKLLKKRDYDIIDTGIELARSLDEPAVFEALLGGWSINDEGKLVLDESFKGETLTRRWSDESWPYFAYAIINLIGFKPNDKETKNNINLLSLSGSGDKWSKENKLLRFPIGLCNFSNLKELNLSNNKIKYLPEEIGQLSKLEFLNLSYNKISENGIPSSMMRLTHLRELNLSENEICDFPKPIGNLVLLENLSLRGKNNYTGFNSIIDEIGNLVKLEVLDLSDNNIKTLPNSIGKLSKLKNLDLSSNNLESLPDSISGLKSLNKLNLDYNKLNSLPNGIFDLDNITILLWNNFNNDELTCEWVESLNKPEHFEKLLFNYTIVTDRNNYQTIKPFYNWYSSKDILKNEKGFIIGEDTWMWNLIGYAPDECKIEGEYRDRIVELEHLKKKRHPLSFQHNQYTNVFDREKIFSISLRWQNNSGFIFKGIFNLKNLETLDVTCPPLKKLPEEFGNLRNLKKLNISNCHSLEDINIIAKIDNLVSLNMEGCDSLKIPPRPKNMVFEKDIKKYKIKLLKAAGEPIPKYLQQKIKTSKELKSYIPKLKKFLKQRNHDSINQGIELIRSLNEPPLYETFLDGCSIDSNGHLVRNKMFSGSGPAQVYYDQVILSLIKYSPQNAEIDESLYHKNIINLGNYAENGPK